MSAYRSPIFKVLSALLGYPTAEVVAAGTDMRRIVNDEPALDETRRAALRSLIDDLIGGDLLELQERYVDHFDRTRSLSLHLFEHVHGESRDRGQAMVDLLALYEKRGLTLTSGELPDYLPAFLEYCALLPRAEAHAMLAQVTHILAAMLRRLEKRGSPYAAVFAALCVLGADAATVGEPSVDAADANEPDTDPGPDDFAALDRLWEEEAVTFGPGQSGAGACGSETLIAKLRYGRRAVPPTAQEGGRP
jgi:nitrate reductase delta subunit